MLNADWRPARRLALTIHAIAIVLALTACMPASPSFSKIQGRYEVSHNYGREVLVLHADSTYIQALEKRGAPSIVHEGKWELRNEQVVLQEKWKLPTTQVVLYDALIFDNGFGGENSTPARRDEVLAAEYVWGQFQLVFNPDLPGFARK